MRKEERIQHTLDMLDALRSSPLSTALYLGGREDSKVLAGAVLWDVFLSAWPLELPGFGREPSKIAELSPDKPNLRESLPALLPGVNLGDKQFGKKVGKHASEWGMDLSKRGEKPSSNAVAYLQRRVQSVVQGYDELRQGPYNPNAVGGNDYLFYRRANTLVLTKPTGDFVSIWKMNNGELNGWYQRATVLFRR